MARRALLIFLGLAALVLGALPAQAQRRLALVVGANEYRSLPRLVRAAGDARSVQTALRRLGFETTGVFEPDREGLEAAVARFVQTLRPDDIAVVHFAGHGTRIEGDYRLLPVDAPPQGAPREDVRAAGGIGVVAIADQIRAVGASGQVIIVDACRGDPYAEGGAFAAGSACGALPRQPPDGTLVLFSASTGQRALDRLGDADADPHSVFTRVLLGALADAGGRSAVDLAREVRDEVARLASSVNHEQRPAYLDEMGGDPVLFGEAPRPVATAPLPEPRTLPPQAPVAPPPPAPPPPRVRVRAPACAGLLPGPPAFDCNAARAPAEIAICRDPGLGSCDRALNRVFGRAEAVAGGAALRRSEDAWVARRNACAGVAGTPDELFVCIGRAYDQRIAELEGIAAAQPAPAPAPAAGPAPVRVERPSFDCRYARSPVEIAVCGDPDLAVKDRELARAYDRALGASPAGAGQIERTQRDWRAARDACARNPGAALERCVARAYDTRIVELRALAGR